jgi:hypothetical protein
MRVWRVGHPASPPAKQLLRKLISGRVDNADQSLTSRVYVDVPNFDCLLAATAMAVESLDHFTLQSKKFDGVRPVKVNERFSHVLLALS